MEITETTTASSSTSGLPNKFFDGKRARRSVVRRTVDYYCTVVQALKNFQYSLYHHQDYSLQDPIQTDPNYIINLLPPLCYVHNPIVSVATKFVHCSMNKLRCPVNVVKWTPEGRRIITGSSSGEFTLWNGLTFNFETILQAHEQSIRSMSWSHNGNFLISGDHAGNIKYWQPNMNNIQVFQSHREPVRDLSFSPTDSKFASCSDDGTIKVWDFLETKEESCLAGHGWDVKNVQWHPSLSLLASGSKDNTVRLWDPRTSKSLATIYGHKNTILDLKWNLSGKCLLTAGKDQVIKLYDLRTLKELQVFKSHKKDVTSLAWHPFHESLFVSGGYDGSMYYWIVGDETPVGAVETAHENAIWALDWHPVGHILASGSMDNSTKFWARNRPGDPLEELDNPKIPFTPMLLSASKDYFNPPTSSDSADSSTSSPMNINLPGLGSREPFPGHLPFAQKYNPSQIPSESVHGRPTPYPHHPPSHPFMPAYQPPPPPSYPIRDGYPSNIHPNPNSHPQPYPDFWSVPASQPPKSHRPENNLPYSHPKRKRP